MKKIHLALLTLVLIALLSACGKGPKCNDEAARAAVLSQARETFKRQFSQTGAPPEAVDRLKFDLTDIKYTGSDGLSGARMCKAELSLTGPNQTKKMPIQYSVEEADGKVIVGLRLGRPAPSSR